MHQHHLLLVSILPAGIMHAPYRLCGGIESQLVVSYVSHCLILSELHKHLNMSARVVFVSSVCHKPGFVQLDDLHGRCEYMRDRRLRTCIEVTIELDVYNAQLCGERS